VPIAKGESVYLAYVSGNRDEDIFDEPFRFDIGREPNKHLSFGYGVHFCLGAALARVEAESALRQLLPYLEGCRRVDRRRTYVDSYQLRGLRHLEIISSRGSQ
jgi:cytochrome P450